MSTTRISPSSTSAVDSGGVAATAYCSLSGEIGDERGAAVEQDLVALVEEVGAPRHEGFEGLVPRLIRGWSFAQQPEAVAEAII